MWATWWFSTRRGRFSRRSIPTPRPRSFSTLLKAYGVAKVIGDRYAGEWVREPFRRHGVDYQLSEVSKSDIYRDALPLFNAGRAQLLDLKRLVNQLCSLERRTARGGRDLIDHPQHPGAHDDLANAACGAFVMLERDRRPQLISVVDVVGVDGLPPPLPRSQCLRRRLGGGRRRRLVYGASSSWSEELFVADFEAVLYHGGFFADLAMRLRELEKTCRAQGCFVMAPGALIRHIEPHALAGLARALHGQDLRRRPSAPMSKAKEDQTGHSLHGLRRVIQAAKSGKGYVARPTTTGGKFEADLVSEIGAFSARIGMPARKKRFRSLRLGLSEQPRHFIARSSGPPSSAGNMMTSVSARLQILFAMCLLGIYSPRTCSSETIEIIGAPDRIRTCGLCLRRAAAWPDRCLREIVNLMSRQRRKDWRSVRKGACVWIFRRRVGAARKTLSPDRRLIRGSRR